MAEHTATPRNRWFLSSSNDAIYEMCADGANRLICFVEPQGSLTRANAAFIVLAVNSHAALVEALDAAEHDISTSNGLHSVAEPTVHLIYDALALAKGASQ